ncbi:MAG: xanthine dehydrogenase family protein molybdopterin-binding subunit [Myxococcota bacterium]|nr:xanthine dehydrogenase family protein molybdopterin-binding subunit [Myxococcota bacterium]
MSETTGLSRRRFLQTTAGAGAGLVLGLHLPMRAVHAAPSADALAPNAFVRITPDDLVTVTVKHVEFGQGPLTGLSTLIAEELDADWSQVRAELAPADVSRFAHMLGPVQTTGGSTAMSNSFLQMRKAGATARAMLVQAAAAEWGVPTSSITIERGRVKEVGGSRSKRFGELVDAASRLTPPEEVTLKQPADFKLIGKEDLRKLDTPAKTNGSAIYTIDVDRPGLLTTLVAHPPRFGARVKKLDDTRSRQVAGVEDVKVLPEGVAVYARGYWAAKQGRDRLEIEWDESATETRDSERVIAEYRELARKPGLPAGRRGEPGAALEGAATVLESEYVFPFLAHAPMEPLDCVIEKQGDRYEVWMGSQGVSRDHAAFAEELGVPQDRIQLNVQLSGGSFGRRAQHKSEFAREAAHALQAIDGRAPIKLLWSREDDIRGGYYRPIYVHRLKGGLDADGRVVAWQQVIVGQSVQKGGSLEKMLIKNGVDLTSVEGAANLSYAVPNLDVSLHSPEFRVPVLWWRSVGHTHTGYTSEAFIDELLTAGGQDPVAGRLALLADHPRHRGVLEAAAEMAGWGGAVPAGRARGVAVHESFGSFVAQVAEVGRDAKGKPKVERVWCAVDCGLAVNPDIVRAQMEGGIGYGLGAALTGEITLAKGRVVQSNFHDYRPIRIGDMPEVEVRVLASVEPPTGVGEPGVPPVAPAVSNAWAALTGERFRRLPFQGASA